MSRRRHFIIALSLLTVSFAPVMAQSGGQNPNPNPGPQNATGTASEEYQNSFGNSAAGGNFWGSSQGDFKANGSTFVTGNASSNGVGNGTPFTAPGFAASASHSNVNALTTSFGDLLSQISASGQAGQSNWAQNTFNAGNFAGGGNQAQGGFSGALDSTGSLSGSGAGSANGKTFGTNTLNGNTASSLVGSFGNSSGALAGMPGSASVAGKGMAGGASIVGGDPSVPGTSFAGGITNMSTLYGGSAANAIGGSLLMNGSTTGVLNPNSASASANASASAGITGGKIPPPAPPNFPMPMQ